MARKPKAILGPSRLSYVLKNLNKLPRPVIPGLKELRLTYAQKNDHFGARHFVKDDLPRIQYANPDARIQVSKVLKSASDTWKPEMVLELENGKTHTIDMSQKWSSTIFTEIMDLAGGPSWAKWKRERKEQGLPPVDVPLAKAKPQAAAASSSKREKKKGEKEPEPMDYHSLFDTSKTGAAAVLP